jgi:hypothetical protein
MAGPRWLAATKLTQRASDQAWKEGSACICAISSDQAIGATKFSSPGPGPKTAVLGC